ncbi:MAG: class I SAM-dependent methyltransferase [Candidatus Aenigmatarchaeota archaeon]
MYNIHYSDSFTQDKRLGWKESKKLRQRREIYRDVYQKLLPKLFEERKKVSIVVAGPSNEEIENIKFLIKKYKNIEIKVFEPNKSRLEELRESLEYVKKRVNLIEDYIFNIEKYLRNNSTDFAILLNVINWIPMNIKKLLEGLYLTLSPRGKVIISFYVMLWNNGKDRSFIIETPEFFKYSIERNSIKSLKEFHLYYMNYNGILETCILRKNNLRKILRDVEEKYKEISKILNFIDSTKLLINYKLN